MTENMAGNTAEQNEACRRAKAEGLVEFYFPNGTSYMCFEEQCGRCRHNLEEFGESNPPKLTPPHGICAWGVLDQITHCMAVSPYGYGTSYHDPDSTELHDGLWPHCKRFTPDDYDRDDRDPPVPDVPGQMMLDDVDVPVERVPVFVQIGATP